MTKFVIPVIFETNTGIMAIRPKNKAPTVVILYKIPCKYSFVATPGRIPGIKPPCF